MPVASDSLVRTPFGTAPDGSAVELFTMRAGSLEMRVSTYGGIIVELCAPDREGRLDDVVLGHDSLERYFDESPYFGAIIGRCANRIAHGRFVLDDVRHELATNNGAQHLHGGVCGFDKVNWHAEPLEGTRGPGVAFTHTSAEGDEGYPGTVEVQVRYMLTEDDELVIEYLATTDRPTVINLTQHSYFNLGGEATPDVLGHRLTIRADHYTPVNDALIPTGDIATVEGTVFDFRTPTAIGARITLPDEQLRRAGGYDHNFVLRAPTSPGALVHAASVVEPGSGRTLDVHTSEPGLQFYSGNFLDGTIQGTHGRTYRHRGGFCLETQHFPDSPNQPSFPSVVLRPGDHYRSRTVYAFGVQR